MARVVRFDAHGGPEVLRISHEDVPPPGAGEIRIHVRAFGLNRAEVMARSGYYPALPPLPSRLGLEVAGEVESVGPGVTQFKQGDRVSVIPFLSYDHTGKWTPASFRYGTYGDMSLLPVEMATLNPDNVSDIDCAALWMQYVTAWGAIVEFARVQPGETVLVTAASSSAGLGAIEIAKAEGARVIASTRGASKRQFLLDGGADDVIVTDEEDLVEGVHTRTDGRGYDVVYDPIGGEIFRSLGMAAAPRARIINYGLLDTRAQIELDGFDMLGKRTVIRFHSVFDTARIPEERERAKIYVYEKAKAGFLRPTIDKVFKLDEIVDAHAHMESNVQRGKIVVRV